MKLTKLIPATLSLLIGCNPTPRQSQEPIPVTSQSSPSDTRAIAMERQREAKMPCSPEWLKKATEVQKKDCVRQSSINQAMNALSTPPSALKESRNGFSNQH